MYWWLAARPKTLIAGLVPVLVGSAYARYQGGGSLKVFFSALMSALSIQVATNFINDAADFEKGADTKDRIGPERMAASGKISPKNLYRAAMLFFVIAFIFGAYLIYTSGPIILVLGIVSIFFAAIYTVGPFPLAYLGLGDLFVFIFFGLVAVLGTIYSQSIALDVDAIILATIVGLQSTTLIAINNLRDIPTDYVVNKKTLSLRMGETWARRYCAFLFLMPLCFWPVIGLKLSIWGLLLPFLATPLVVSAIKNSFSIQNRIQFNSLLAKAAIIQLVEGVLMSIALYFGDR